MSTNQQCTISKYQVEEPAMTGYVVTVKAGGNESQYDFGDSYELALEYRDALSKAWDSWSAAVAVAEYAPVSKADAKWQAVAELWGGYLVLAHDAIYPRWQDETEYAEVEDIEDWRSNLVDQEPTYEGWE